jgi:predicted DNA-binding transcriptional regulator AlpA
MTVRLVDASELASILGISTRTLARMVKKGDVPQPLAVGRLRRWNPGVVNSALSRKAKEARR